jgi:hypothetical protein
MDDLLALMGNAEETITSEIAKVNSDDENVFFPEENTVKEMSNARHQMSNKGGSVGTVDPLTKIRIVNRKKSKVEMVDIVSSMSFHSTASLANMSKAELSALIVKPSANDDAAGKSNMATMGIVFTNSGTRISKNGRGFCVFTVGDLHTGPTVSVFLFGDAYSTHTKQVKAGDVIAVLASNILPSQNGRETRISLSVNDSDQMVNVGKAMDYGLCSMVEKKKVKYNNAFHSGVMEQDVRCKNYVDLRCTTYCKLHMKKAKDQNQKQSGSVVRGGKKTQTFMQNMREEYRMKPPSSTFHSNNVLTMHMPSGQKVVTTKLSANLNTQQPSLSSSGGMTVSTALQDALFSKNESLKMNFGSRIEANKNLVSTTSSLRKAPKHMNIPAGSLNTNHSVVNKIVHHIDLLGEALKVDKTSNTINASERKRQRIQMSEQYDGKVQVPGPSSLFEEHISSKTPAMNTKRAVPSHQNIATPSPEQQQQIIEQQKRLADQLKKQTATSNVINPYKNNAKSITSSDNFFSQVTLSDETKSSILSAKSKFSSEAESALYARSRHAMNELEKQEGALEKREAKKKSNQGNDQTLIISVYICATCKKTTKFKPQTCIRQRHQVKVRRELKKKKEELADSRQKKNKDATKDGGLVLGAGLEWSGWTHRDD